MDMRRASKAIIAVAALVVLIASVARLSQRSGRWSGVWYRLLGRRPDPNVDGATLADRIRSELGPLEKRLDLPHVHVMVEDHIALLHGEVGWPHEAAAIERAVGEVSGVRGVESYLHVGLLRSDVRPSEGRRVPRPPSDAKSRLMAAARSAGAGEAHATEAVRATLAVLAERIPPGEREQLLGHLPEDVRDLASQPRRAGSAAARYRTVRDLVSAVVSEQGDAVDERAEAIVAAVLHEVRRLVPEEADDVAAVLPPELRELWCAPGSA
jgi:uncharacterized protein (DUF2267 family)